MKGLPVFSIKLLNSISSKAALCKITRFGSTMTLVWQDFKINIIIVKIMAVLRSVE